MNNEKFKFKNLIEMYYGFKYNYRLPTLPFDMYVDDTLQYVPFQQNVLFNKTKQ